MFDLVADGTQPQSAAGRTIRSGFLPSVSEAEVRATIHVLREQDLLVAFSGSEKDQFKVMKGQVKFWVQDYASNTELRAAIVRRMIKKDPNLVVEADSSKPNSLQKDIISVNVYAVSCSR